MNYRQVHYLTRHIMPRVSANAFKVITAVADQTWGWRKESVVLTYDQLRELTGIASNKTVARAIREAAPYLETSGVRRGTMTYSLRESTTESVVDDEESSTVSVVDGFTTTTESVVDTTTESVVDEAQTTTLLTSLLLDKEIRERIGEKEPPPPPRRPDDDPLVELVKIFEEATGIKAPHLKGKRARENWLDPLIDLHQQTGERFEHTVALIPLAVAEMRRDKLTIASPQSIVNVALGLHSNGQGVNGHQPAEVLDPRVKMLRDSLVDFDPTAPWEEIFAS